MGFEADKAQHELQGEFNSLTIEKGRLKAHASQWIGRAASLHTNADGTEYKADVLALRDALIADLRAVLGV